MSYLGNLQNPFKHTTIKEQERKLREEQQKAEEAYLDWLDAAVRIDPENKQGQW